MQTQRPWVEQSVSLPDLARQTGSDDGAPRHWSRFAVLPLESAEPATINEDAEGSFNARHAATGWVNLTWCDHSEASTRRAHVVASVRSPASDVPGKWQQLFCLNGTAPRHTTVEVVLLPTALEDAVTSALATARPDGTVTPLVELALGVCDPDGQLEVTCAELLLPWPVLQLEEQQTIEDVGEEAIGKMAASAPAPEPLPEIAEEGTRPPSAPVEKALSVIAVPTAKHLAARTAARAAARRRRSELSRAVQHAETHN